MVTTILEEDPEYNNSEQEGYVARFDHRNKHIWHSNELTIISYALNADSTKLSFGSPSDYIIF
jgi:hypothetical protein